MSPNSIQSTANMVIFLTFIRRALQELILFCFYFELEDSASILDEFFLKLRTILLFTENILAGSVSNFCNVFTNAQFEF